MGAKLDTGVGSKRGEAPVNAEPNVIPFIDVMLVLLIIFMVTAPIASVDIKTEMPAADVIASKRANKPVWVTLVDGPDCQQAVKGVNVQTCPGFFVMEEAVDSSAIGPRTMEALRFNNPRIADDLEALREQRIYVRASGGTPYKNVMLVMNRLQDEGLTKIALVSNDPTP
jgi:biopolymer transport protein ExbD